MSIGNGDYAQHSMYEPTSSSMSKAELRKCHKPIMEKKRRAKINKCLNEIKSLILDAMKKDPARHSKLEKADILEMAVRHLQNVQRRELATAMTSTPSVLDKFKTGFNDCIGEVDSYIAHMEGYSNSSIKKRIVDHLTKCITGLEQVIHISQSNIGPFPFLTRPSSPQMPPNVQTPRADDQNNNPKLSVHQQVQLIPSRLPSGELALVFPTKHIPAFGSLLSDGKIRDTREKPSAFVTVIPSGNIRSFFDAAKVPSPPASPVSTSGHTSQVAKSEPTSPIGFRPVKSNKYIPNRPESNAIYTSVLQRANDLTTIKSTSYSISSPLEKESCSEKPDKPLSIITNLRERFRHGQIVTDTSPCQENREAQDQGLLTIAVPNQYHDRNEGETMCEKFEHSHCSGSKDLRKLQKPDSTAEVHSLSDEQNMDTGSDANMWRPW